MEVTPEMSKVVFEWWIKSNDFWFQIGYYSAIIIRYSAILNLYGRTQRTR
jgi:hypothetical protein